MNSPDSLVESVGYEMLCENGEQFRDQFSLVEDAAIPTWGTSVDLPAGQCDALFTAFNAKQEPICGGALRFPVEIDQTTEPFVELDCSQLDADPSATGGGNTSNGGGAAVLDTDLADFDGVEDPDLVDFDDVTLNLCAVVVVGFRDLAGVGVGLFIDNSVGDQEITVVTDETCLHESVTSDREVVAPAPSEPPVPPVSCDTLDCDDGNDCTQDSCSDGICSNAPAGSVPTPCNDGAGICLGAICVEAP